MQAFGPTHRLPGSISRQNPYLRPCEFRSRARKCAWLSMAPSEGSRGARSAQALRSRRRREIASRRRDPARSRQDVGKAGSRPRGICLPGPRRRGAAPRKDGHRDRSRVRDVRRSARSSARHSIRKASARAASGWAPARLSAFCSASKSSKSGRRFR